MMPFFLSWHTSIVFHIEVGLRVLELSSIFFGLAEGCKKMGAPTARLKVPRKRLLAKACRWEVTTLYAWFFYMSCFLFSCFFARCAQNKAPRERCNRLAERSHTPRRLRQI